MALHDELTKLDIFVRILPRRIELSRSRSPSCAWTLIGRSASQLYGQKPSVSFRPSRSRFTPFARTKNGIRLKGSISLTVFGSLCACQAFKIPRVGFLPYGDAISSSSRMGVLEHTAENTQSGSVLLVRISVNPFNSPSNLIFQTPEDYGIVRLL